MKLVANSFVLFLLLNGSASAVKCGGDLSIAGSSTVLPVAEKWAAAYMELCPETTVTVESGGSSAGAGRVCDNPERGEAVDIGNMSRDWKTSEARELQDGYTFDCLMGDTSRTAIQVDVSEFNGMTIACHRCVTASSL